jgi:hypothetical protein
LQLNTADPAQPTVSRLWHAAEQVSSFAFPVWMLLPLLLDSVPFPSHPMLAATSIVLFRCNPPGEPV